MNNGFIDKVVKKNFIKMFKLPLYKVLIALLGFPVMLVAFIKYFRREDKNELDSEKEKIIAQLKEKGEDKRIEAMISEQIEKKNKFLRKNPSPEKKATELQKLSKREFDELVMLELSKSKYANSGKLGFAAYFCSLLNDKSFLLFSVVLGFLMYILIFMYSNPYVKYIFERLVMMVFVIFGVTFLVFTILHMSPMDAAKNILGTTATQDQIVEFNRVYGLDKPYVEQLFNAFKGIVTFDMGKSYLGNEDVMSAVMRRFPTTLTITFWALLVSLMVAIPAGIFSAIKPYSLYDYLFMLVALLGLSIPNFWLGLVMIINFSINNKMLPSLFVVGNWKSLIMPIAVLGTGLAASVARMTRSSMLEVIKQDYVVTARAKGLSQRSVVIRHVLSNAMIPIVTVVGLQFGGMLGGSAVTEKVFNVNGIGSYIVDKQFVPDIPVVLAGTVYIAIIISLANLLVDIVYAFLDPRIKSKMKNY